MATRGKVKAIYATDSGAGFGWHVDADYFADASRGWTAPAAGQVLTLSPKGFRPRKVYGIDTTGRHGSAVVATTDAPLWAGTASTFVAEGDDLADHTFTVTSRVGEKLKLVTG